MKKTMLTLSLLVVAVVLSLSVFCPNNNCSASAFGNKITVTGNAEIKIIPDVAIVSMGIETLNEDLITAQKETSDKMTEVVNTLLANGVKKENIKTKNFNVYQRYDYSQDNKFIGYQVSNYLDFRTKDIDNLGMLVSKIMEKGANNFSGINFTIEDMDSAYKTALAKALTNASDKAAALANGAVEIQEICEENTYDVSPRYSSVMFADALKEANTLMKGEVSVKATLKVIYTTV